MAIKVAPSTFHTIKFISENPGCTSGDFCRNFGKDLAWIRSPYYSTMLSLNIEGSGPHPRSSLGRGIVYIQDIESSIAAGTRKDYEGRIDLHEAVERGRNRRNWIYRTKRGSKVFRYYLTNKALAIIDDLECNNFDGTWVSYGSDCSHCSK